MKNKNKARKYFLVFYYIQTLKNLLEYCQYQTKILRTIVQLAKKKNITCIFNTHYPEYALRISDKSMLIGKDEYIIGKTSEIINEENLKKYFEIDTKIVEIEDKKQKIKSVVITDNLEE